MLLATVSCFVYYFSGLPAQGYWLTRNGVQLTYTGVIVFVNETAQNLDNYLPDGVYETFSPQDVKNAIFGSKCVFITEEFILATLWLCKACLLILYSSLT